MSDMARIDATKENEDRPSAVQLRMEGFRKLLAYAYLPGHDYTLHWWHRAADRCCVLEYVPRRVGLVAYIARDYRSQCYLSLLVGIAPISPLESWHWQSEDDGPA